MLIFPRKALELGVLLSCLILALILFQLGIYFFNEKPFPHRLYIITGLCFSTLVLGVCFSIKDKWKTIVVFSALIVMFLLGFITAVGFNLVMNYIFEERSIQSLGVGLAFLIIGGVLTWTILIFINSKKLY